MSDVTQVTIPDGPSNRLGNLIQMAVLLLMIVASWVSQREEMAIIKTQIAIANKMRDEDKRDVKESLTEIKTSIDKLNQKLDKNQ